MTVVLNEATEPIDFHKRLNLRYLTAKYHGGTITPKFVVIHHDATLRSTRLNRDGSKPEGWNKPIDLAEYLANPGALSKKPSAHFHINWKGVVTVYTNIIGLTEQWVKKANHAGVSRYEYNGVIYKGLNNYSIGIEVGGNTNKWALDADEYIALCTLCKWINRQFPELAHRDRYLRHADVAYPKGRKVDIGLKFFNWKAFLDQVFT